MSPKFERVSSGAQGLQIENLQHLIEGGEYLKAKGWIELKINYLEGVIREMPRTEAEVDSVSLADWQKLRSDLLGELDYWRCELVVLENIIKSSK